MALVISLFLPLALVIIMFSLGLGLTIADFGRIALKPRAFVVGIAAQLLVLPAFAYALAVLFRLPAELAVGLMILSFCPGGPSSNMMTKIANGDVALAISLTGVTTIIAIFTVPVLTKLAADHFMGLDASTVDVTSLGVTMALLTFVPVAAGIGLRHVVPAFAFRLEKVVSRIAVTFFAIVVIGALASNWHIFTDNIPLLGPALVLLNVFMMAMGLGAAWLLSLTLAEGKAISIEAGIQNAAIGMTVGTLIATQPSALPAFSLPAGVYGITMYLVSIPVVLWMRSWRSASVR